MFPPLTKILDRLTDAWGSPGNPGDINDIHHTCLLLRNCLEQIVAHEQRIRAARTSEGSERLVGLLHDAFGSQIEKFREVPDWLDELVQKAVDDELNMPDDGQPLIISRTIHFTLPENWSDDVNRELKRISNRASFLHRVSGQADAANTQPVQTTNGCTIWLVVVVFVVFSLILL